MKHLNTDGPLTSGGDEELKIHPPESDNRFSDHSEESSKATNEEPGGIDEDLEQFFDNHFGNLTVAQVHAGNDYTFAAPPVSTHNAIVNDVFFGSNDQVLTELVPPSSNNGDDTFLHPGGLEATFCNSRAPKNVTFNESANKTFAPPANNNCSGIMPDTPRTYPKRRRLIDSFSQASDLPPWGTDPVELIAKTIVSNPHMPTKDKAGIVLAILELLRNCPSGMVKIIIRQDFCKELGKILAHCLDDNSQPKFFQAVLQVVNLIANENQTGKDMIQRYCGGSLRKISEQCSIMKLANDVLSIL